jgi:hypothetical protein
MCDYSLEHVKSRPARVGENLVSKKFSGTVTTGFTSPREQDVAICLMPGTELKFAKDVKVRASMAFLPARKIRARVARFRQVNMHNRHVHHDALEFPDGCVVLLNHLIPGQRATVLQLPVSGEVGHHHPDGHHHHDHAHPAARAEPATLAPSDRETVKA